MVGGPTVRAFYFGCVGDVGHYFLESRDGHPVPDRREERFEEVVPWGWGVERLASLPKQPEVEGAALLHHLNGWTALAFPDRSVDSRGASKSVFCFDALLDFDAALAAAREAFPSIFARYTFGVRPAHSDATSVE